MKFFSYYRTKTQNVLEINVDITEAVEVTKMLHVKLLLQVHLFIAECAVSVLNFCVIEGGGVHL